MHGHTKIELTNVHTGEVEVVEKDNIVTNAVSRIFNGFGGRINVQQLLANGDPDLKSGSLVSDFYGGLLLFDKALGSDPNTIFAPADANIIGCAVYDVVNTGTNTVRGSCNKTESNIDMDEGVATFVYDFATSQGNGTISSVCLTNLLGGFFGEAPNALPLCDGSGSRQYITTNNNTWDGYFPLFKGIIGACPSFGNGWPVYVDEDNNAIVLAKVTFEKQLEVRKYEFPVTTIDLFHKSNTARVISEETYDVSSIVQGTVNKASYGYDFSQPYNFITCDAEHLKWYLICCPSYSSIAKNAKVNIREFDISTNTYKDYSVTNTLGVELSARGGSTYGSGWGLGICVYDGYIYLAESGGTQIYKIKLSDPTEIIKIEMNGLIWGCPEDAYQGKIYFYTNGSPSLNPNKGGTVLNTETNEMHGIEAMEALAKHDYSFEVKTHIIPSIRQTLTPYCTEAYWWGNSYRGEADAALYGLQRVLRRNYLATINDLPSPVEKTADKTMKITYTLRRS